MKIGWLVWEDGDDFPTLVPEGDDRLYWCSRKVQIVYTEVVT